MLGALIVSAVAIKAQEDDDYNYGTPQGAQSQGEGDSYGPNYQNDDGYNNAAPNNYNQNVDADGSNQAPNQYPPQGGNNADADGDYEGDDNSARAAASTLSNTVVRVKRSTVVDAKATGSPLVSAESAPKLRVKRHGKHYIGPVYTYVKTDKHAHFKWGVSICFN